MSKSQQGLVQGFSANDFTFNVTKGPAASPDDSDSFAGELGFEPPRLLYPHNQIRIAHKLSNFSLAFYARPALNLVDKSGAEAERVAYALNEGTKLQLPDKNFDWTYTTTYSGSSTRSFDNTPYGSMPCTPLPPNSHSDADDDVIRNTIKFFEDNMDGAGYTTLTATLQVDDNGFQVLQRHFVRIDHILFRMYECTFSHNFGSWEIEKRCKGWEGRWSEVFRRLPPVYQNVEESSQHYQDTVRDVLLSLSPENHISRRATALQPPQMLRTTSGDSSSSANANASAGMGSRSSSRMGFAARVLLSRHNSATSNASSSRRRRKHPPGALSFSAAKPRSASGSLQSSCVSPMSSGCCSPSAVSGAGTGWNGVGKWKYKITLSDENDEVIRTLPSPFPPENADLEYELDSWEYERRRSFGYNNMFNDFSSASSSDDDDGYAYDQMDVAQQLTKRLERFSRLYPERLVDGDYDDDFDDI
ncbi:hypothetical protein E3P99_01685 [Wallemia hederae]|uniref:Uncharacterized protein n=1 Tax=Wallemia hederae TaxID=1540922 RepID=A0A4T0FP61_9BASI|nr:hypothetical protein E3P99_01685 [Wallemia hederae]